MPEGFGLTSPPLLMGYLPHPFKSQMRNIPVMQMCRHAHGHYTLAVSSPCILVTDLETYYIPPLSFSSFDFYFRFLLFSLSFIVLFHSLLSFSSFLIFILLLFPSLLSSPTPTLFSSSFIVLFPTPPPSSS